jgi:hypothetical protein
MKKDVLPFSNDTTDLRLLCAIFTGKRGHSWPARLRHHQDLHCIDLHYTDPTVYIKPNNYVKPYDYANIYVEFYIAKVYINMVSIDNFVNTAVAYNQKPRRHRRSAAAAALQHKNPPPLQNRCRRRTTTKTAAAAEPLPPPRYDKNPPPPQNRCRRRTKPKTL